MVNRAPIHRNITRPGRYAIGKHAVGIDHRSGFKVLLKDLKYEPGTNYLVTADENDWDHNLVTDQLNFSPEKKTERIALRWSFPDVPLSIGTIVSADHLFIPSYISVSNHFLQHTSIATGVSIVSVGTGVSASVGAGVSGARLDFSISTNSQYYLIVFPGI